MRITNNCNLPDGLYRAILNDDYPTGAEACWDISTTRLIAPPRIDILRMAYDAELTEDASNRIWSLMGQLGHKVCERGELAALAEMRLTMEVAGWVISGALDTLTIDERGVVGDYKFTSVWTAKEGVKREWVEQGNINAELAERNGQPVAGIEIVTIYRDWSKRKARIGEHPRQQVQVHNVPLWPKGQRVNFIESLVSTHKLARKAHQQGLPLPECTPEERWAKPTTYAVKKQGRKSAIRVLSSLKEAEAMAKVLGTGHSVETRPGESTRCLDYCNVATVCDQWAKIKEESNG